MNTLNIITRCTRPENLDKVKESIFNNQANFDIVWWVIFDTSIVKQIPSQIVQGLIEDGVKVEFQKGKEGDFGHDLINKTLDKIPSGWVYFLDDDNILHERFCEEISSAIQSFPDKSGFLFDQYVGGRDFTGLDIREIDLNNISVGKIDIAQFVLSRELIGDIRLPLYTYVADGLFIEAIFKIHPDKFSALKEVLCYYNHIQKQKINSLPRILVVGTDKELDLKSKFYVDYESTELNTKCVKDDHEIDKIITTFNPDGIVSVGKSFANFPRLSYHCLDVRSRWLHFEEINENTGESAYQCANNYILSDYNSENPLISFFTPVYNTGEKLFRTYESVSNQTYTNWEWVIVNDSTDNGLTLKIAEQIAEKDCRVKVYDFGKKSGGIVGESKYRAASLSQGKYLMELDHDDYLLPDAGRLMVETFKQYPECKFVYSDCAEIYENHQSLTYGDGFSFGYGSYREEAFNGRVYKVAVTSNINPKTIRHIVGVPNHFRAWERAFYHSIGGHNRRLTIADDYELIVRTFLKTRMVKIPKLLYLQFYHNSNTQDLTRKDIQRRVKSIMHFYNHNIKKRFEELGLVDWAYDENPTNPLAVESRFGSLEGYANFIAGFNYDLQYQNFGSVSPVLSI